MKKAKKIAIAPNLLAEVVNDTHGDANAVIVGEKAPGECMAIVAASIQDDSVELKPLTLVVYGKFLDAVEAYNGTNMADVLRTFYMTAACKAYTQGYVVNLIARSFVVVVPHVGRQAFIEESGRWITPAEHLRGSLNNTLRRHAIPKRGPLTPNYIVKTVGKKLKEDGFELNVAKVVKLFAVSPHDAVMAPTQDRQAPHSLFGTRPTLAGSGGSLVTQLIGGGLGGANGPYLEDNAGLDAYAAGGLGSDPHPAGGLDSFGSPVVGRMMIPTNNPTPTPGQLQSPAFSLGQYPASPAVQCMMKAAEFGDRFATVFKEERAAGWAFLKEQQEADSKMQQHARQVHLDAQKNYESRDREYKILRGELNNKAKTAEQIMLQLTNCAKAVIAKETGVSVDTLAALPTDNAGILAFQDSSQSDDGYESPPATPVQNTRASAKKTKAAAKAAGNKTPRAAGNKTPSAAGYKTPKQAQASTRPPRSTKNSTKKAQAGNKAGGGGRGGNNNNDTYQTPVARPKTQKEKTLTAKKQQLLRERARHAENTPEREEIDKELADVERDLNVLVGVQVLSAEKAKSAGGSNSNRNNSRSSNNKRNNSNNKRTTRRNTRNNNN